MRPLPTESGLWLLDHVAVAHDACARGELLIHESGAFALSPRAPSPASCTPSAPRAPPDTPRAPPDVPRPAFDEMEWVLVECPARIDEP